MNKQEVINLIIIQLEANISVAQQAVDVARDTATHADCLGSSKYETMGLEASYLAQGQGTRLLEVERSLEYFENLTMADQATLVGLSSLVALNDEQGNHQLLWLAAEAGGLKVQWGETEVTVITPRSPLGRALMGKVAGDEIAVHITGRTRHYELLAVY